MSLVEGAEGASHARFEVLLRAALDLTAEHELDQILDRMVRYAAEVADATYAALGVYDGAGHIESFVHSGIDTKTVARIGALPTGGGLLGEVVVAHGPIRLTELTTDSRSCGFPPHHPPMHSFLGVPVGIGGQRFGNLYLTEKRNGSEFTAEDERLLVTLATFAAAAIAAALRMATERERATAQVELTAARERSRAQRETLAQVIRAQEAERARVARDLHDQIGQSLTSVLLGLRLVTDSLSGDEPDVADALARAAEVRGLVADALQEARDLAFVLRPTVLDDVGLVPALRRLVTDFTARHGTPVDLALAGLADDSRFPAELETVVYRVVQEALTNVGRHANASEAAVAVTASPRELRVSVRDNGAGFDTLANRPRSLGLTGMEERAALVGGQVEIITAPAAGTTIVLAVSLD